MTQQTKAIVAVVLLIVAAGLVWWFMAAGSAPGRGQEAELIDPVTHARTKVMMDHVIRDGMQDPSGAGWMLPVPGSPYWGYVVRPGEKHPSESDPKFKPFNPKARPGQEEIKPPSK